MEQLATIKKKAGLAPFTLLSCADCSLVAESCKQDSQFTWCSTLQCPNCQKPWWICRRCPSQRVAFHTRSHVSRHHRIKHIDDLAPASPPPSFRPLASLATLPVESQKVKMKNLRAKIPEGLFVREASHQYFSHAQDGITRSSHIVAQAVFQNASVASSLHPDDVHMVMTISTLIDTMTRTQRENLATVLELAVNCTTRQLTEKNDTKPTARASKKLKFSESQRNNNGWNIPVPSSKESLRAIFIEGKHSIKENIPHPSILEDTTGHAYILPSECMADCMAHGLLDYNVTGKEATYKLLPSSSKGVELASKDLTKRTIYLTLWCDDFEPNYSIKGGRGSVWLLTLTLESIDSGPAGICHVYPIAVGLKGTDHNEVLCTIWEDLKRLRGGITVFNGYKKATEEVRGEVIAWTMDQPESRGTNGLMLGGSTSFARFGHAVNISMLKERIRPCRNCFSNMVAVTGGALWEDRNKCNLCNNWMAHGVMDYEAPEGYPAEKLKNGKLRPLCVTYDLLKEASQEAHSKIVSGEWSHSTASVYLKAMGLNTTSTDRLIACAINIRSLAQAEEALNHENNEENRSLLQAFQEEKEATPTAFEPWKYPAPWTSGLELQQCHQAGMHLLFLGIVKSMVFVVQDWAIKRKKYTTLRDSIKLGAVRLGELKLSWLKIQPYQGDKLGGWVSENYMALARVLPWLYGSIDELPDDDKYELPERSHLKWNGVECRNWLRSRHLPTKGNAKDLKDRVKENWGAPEAESVGGKLETVKQVLLAEWCFISYLMGMTGCDEVNDEVNTSSRLIRLFLTYLYDHEASMGGTKDTWLSSYNFVCLLNLPEQIKMLGPIRNRWEGGVKGEGFLRVVKPMVLGTGRNNWQRNLLSNLVKHKSMLLVSNGRENEQTNSNNIDLSSVKVYPCLAKFIADFVGHEPLAIVVDKRCAGDANYKCFYGLYKAGSSRSVVQLLPVESGTKKTCFGQIYHEFRYIADCDGMLDSDIQVESYAILLPHRDENPDLKLYTLVSDQWKVLDSEYNITFPHMYLDMSKRNWQD